MEKLVIINCINFQREQIDVDKLPCVGNFSVLPFACPTLQSTIKRPVNVEVGTDNIGFSAGLCQETEMCRKLQTNYD